MANLIYPSVNYVDRMQVTPLMCDECKARMGLMIYPDGVDANTCKLIFQGLSLVIQCPECDFILKKERRDKAEKEKKEADEAEKAYKEDMAKQPINVDNGDAKQLEKKFEKVDNHKFKKKTKVAKET